MTVRDEAAILLAFIVTLVCTTMTGCVPYKTIETEFFVAWHQDKQGFEDLNAEARDAVEGAEDLLGYRLVLVRKAPIRVELIHSKDAYRGRYWREGLCNYHVRAIPDEYVLAHEIGHVLGLGHTNTRGNVMHRADPESTFTDHQRDIMRKNAKKIERWCWDSSEPEKRSADLSTDGGDGCELE